MDNTRIFLYAALAFVGLLIWEQWKIDYGPQPAESVSNQQMEHNQAANRSTDPSMDLPDAGALAAQPMSSDVPGDSTVSAPARLVSVETDVFDIRIDTRGAVIKSVKLKKYPVDVEHPEDYLELIHSEFNSVYVIQNGLRSQESPAPTHHDVFQVGQESYTLKEGEETLRVPFSWVQDGIEVTKVYEFQRGAYLIEVDHQVNNRSDKPWTGTQYRQIQRSRPLETSNFLYTYTGAVVYNDAVKYEKVDFDDMEEQAFRLDSNGGWVAMIQHYFLSAWVAGEQENNLMYSLANPRVLPNTYTIGMRSKPQQIGVGEQGRFNSRLFIGPKLVDRLEAISPGLELTVDYGALTFLSKPLYLLLAFFNDIVGNWGFAIILLTILVKALFFKLSEASYKSMAKMRKVAPRLKTLKERYGDDRQKMNQAMMDLYKTEKINPMGGCLPILVQIPVFIALYWALLESVELRQAPFILWINDLSVMDPYFVLPLIMGVSMFVQQKLNPAPPDPIQAKMMMILPFVFTVFFAFFPAGLVLYWVVNNLLSITQQYIITKRIESGEMK